MNNNFKTRVYPYYFDPSLQKVNSKIVKSCVREIISTVKRYLKKDITSINVLDMGAGKGEYAIEMARYFKKVVGVEPNKKAYDIARKAIPTKLDNLSFFNCKLEDFKQKGKFDLIVSLTVFEHLPNPKITFDKAFFLLKKGGIIYLTAPNKYWLFEQHYGLPFLSWIPLSVANLYLQVTKGVTSFKDSSYAKSYGGMSAFFNKYNCEYSFILPFNINSQYFGCGKQGYYSFMKRFGVNLIRRYPFFWYLSKGFIMVLKKK